MLPQDPMILLSMINMKLRDGGGDLDDLCADLDVDRQELEKRLENAGFRYEPELRQFR